jgi:3-oxoacyl-[acyl-carrier-protein] synthase-1/3-oxoacyl-[acyl-carrier-protein] synthase II
VSSIAIVAFGAVSGLGEGVAAATAGVVGEAAELAIGVDLELSRAGLSHPFAARARALPGGDLGGAESLIVRAFEQCSRELDALRPRWRAERVGLILGTSSGGMRAAERAFDAVARGERVEDAEEATYYGPMARAVRRTGVAFDPAILVLGACASATIAIGLGVRWLERDACDLVLCGGFDEVTVFVAAGFDSLKAVTATPPPRPFRLGRDGMALGEGAAVVALVNSSRADGAVARALVAGFGASSDAVHLTAPDREGRGLARAALAALEEAGRPAVDLVSAHATATPFNDPSEARGLARALGDGRAREVVIHPFKAQIGHTLGAAGGLEMLAMVDAMERGVMPAAAGDGLLDPESPAVLLPRAVAGAPRVALKVSSAFGGANAALVVGRDLEGVTRPRRSAFVHAAVHAPGELAIEALAEATRTPAERLLRADPLARVAMAAVAQLERAMGPGTLAGAGIVVGSAFATLETNAVYWARVRERGAKAAEPRRFPYTSPNAVAGECSLAFGLTGPSFTVGGGMHAPIEALAAAAVLVEAGDAERIVVVGVDEAGPMTAALGASAIRTGALAVLIDAREATPAGPARARVGAISLARGRPSGGLSPGELEPTVSFADAGPTHPGHLALLPLLNRRLPLAIAASSPPDAHARVALEPLGRASDIPPRDGEPF